MLLWGRSWCCTVCWYGCTRVVIRPETVASPVRSAGSVPLSQVFDRWCSQRCLVLRSCVDLRSSWCVLVVGGWSLCPSVAVGCGTCSCSRRLVGDDSSVSSLSQTVCQSAICLKIGFRYAWADFKWKCKWNAVNQRSTSDDDVYIPTTLWRSRSKEITQRRASWKTADRTVTPHAK